MHELAQIRLSEVHCTFQRELQENIQKKKMKEIIPKKENKERRKRLLKCK